MPYRFYRALNRPGPGAAILQTHSLSQGLGAVVLCGSEILPRDIVTGTLLSNGVAAATVGPSEGNGFYGLRCDANNEGAFYAIGATMQPLTTLSYFWRGHVLNGTTPTASAGISQVSFTNSSTTPFVAYGFGVSSSGTTVVWFYDAAATLRSLDSLVVYNADARPHDWLATMDGTTVNLYKDGELAKTAGQTAGNLSYGTPRLQIGEQFSLTRNPSSVTDVVYVWPNRALTPKDAALLHADPYCILRRPNFTSQTIKIPAVASGRKSRLTLLGIG
jgi:hypothetical protein